MKNLLFYRLTVFNTMMAALTGWIGMTWVEKIIAGDSSYITWVITGLFVLILMSTFRQAYKTSKDYNYLKELSVETTAPIPTLIDQVRAKKRLLRIGHIQQGAIVLGTLGLIGTVVGFILSLEAVDGASLATSEGTQLAVASMIDGMGVALYTTLVGAYFGLWTDVNYQILKTTVSALVVDETHD